MLIGQRSGRDAHLVIGSLTFTLSPHFNIICLVGGGDIVILCNTARAAYATGYGAHHSDSPGNP